MLSQNINDVIRQSKPFSVLKTSCCLFKVSLISYFDVDNKTDSNSLRMTEDVSCRDNYQGYFFFVPTFMYSYKYPSF
jgi:hypothetical protein